MSNLTEIRHRVRNLLNLLDAPEPGVRIWRDKYEKASASVLEFYGVNVDKIKQETWDLAVEQTIGDMERAQRKTCTHGVAALVDIFHHSGACMLPQDPPTLVGPPIEVCPQCGSKSKKFRGSIGGDWCRNIWHHAS